MRDISSPITIHSRKKGSLFTRKTVVSVLAVLLIVLLTLLGVMAYIIAKFHEKDSVQIRFKRTTDLPFGFGAIQFQGVQPTAHDDDNGIIGPWATKETNLAWATLNDVGTEVTIHSSGQYYIYAQVFYLTKEESNTFQILRYRQHQDDETLSMCAINAPVATSGNTVESSCFTAVIVTLDAGDHILLHQIDPERTILLTPGFSHWGLIKLRSSQIEL